MPIAVFGTKLFEVSQNKIHTFEDFQYKSNLDTEKQDSAGKKPSTYNKGPGLNSISFKIILDAAWGLNPRREIEDWEIIKDAGVAYPFILAGKPMGANKYLLIDLQVTEPVIDNAGYMLRAVLSLSFDEYVRPGTAASKSAGNANSTPGILSPSAQNDVAILSPSQKEQLKRNYTRSRV